MHLEAAVALLVLFGACSSSKPQPFTLEGPPLIRAPVAFAGVADGRARFREIYRAVCERDGLDADAWLWRLTDEPDSEGAPVDLGPLPVRLRLLIVPGLLNESIADRVTPFSTSRAQLAGLGVRSDLILVSGRSSCEHNARQIRDGLAAMEFAPGERVVLLGHSKGAADSLVALALFPEVRARVDAMVSVAGAIGGSPIADTASDSLRKMVRDGPVPNSEPGDGQALGELRRQRRQRWLSDHPLPAGVAYFSVGAFVQRKDVSMAFRSYWDDLALLDPRNDGQLLFSDQVVPAGTLLGFVRADHWAVAIPFEEEWGFVANTLATRNEFPRRTLLEAILRAVAETFEAAP